MASEREVVVYGAGGHGMVVCDSILTAADGLRVVGFVDANVAKQGTRIMDLPVIGPVDMLGGRDVVVAMGIGDNSSRSREFARLAQLGLPVITVIHRSAVVSPRATVGAGVVVMANVAINVEACIGDDVILNTGCSIDHHCIVGAHAHIAPGATLAGGVRIGEYTLVGAGAVVIPGVSVGRDCIVAAGAVVTSDVADGVTVAGVPARVTRESSAPRDLQI